MSGTEDEFHPARQFVLKKLEEILCDSKLSSQIEEGIHDWSIEKAEKEAIDLTWSSIFKSVYMNKAVAIYTNLDKDSYVKNKDFAEKVKNGEFDSLRVAWLTPHEMFPQKWKTLLDAESLIAQQNYETRTDNACDLYRCGKCGKSQTTFALAQTRSADEPMTIFVTCLVCGNKFRG